MEHALLNDESKEDIIPLWGQGFCRDWPEMVDMVPGHFLPLRWLVITYKWVSTLPIIGRGSSVGFP